MTITAATQGQYVRTKQVPLTALNLYLLRVGSISDKIRAETSGYNYLPFQLGGIGGQQGALVNNVVVSVVDFKVSGL